MGAFQQKGDKKVETFTHDKAGVECEIYLRHTQFVATLLETEFSAPDISQLRRKLRDHAEHWMDMDWWPILSIEVDDDSGSSYSYYRRNRRGEKASIGLKTDRFYLSRSPSGQIWEVAWEVDEEHRKAQMTHWDDERTIRLTGLPLRAPLKRGDTTYHDYEDLLWNRLEAIKDSIRMLSGRLSEIVMTKKGISQLISSGGASLFLKGK